MSKVVNYLKKRQEVLEKMQNYDVENFEKLWDMAEKLEEWYRNDTRFNHKEDGLI